MLSVYWCPTMTDSPQNGFLGDFLTFKNGRSHPGLTEAGHYRVFGANGPIGMTTASNADATTVVVGRVGAYCGSVHLATGRTWVTDNAIAVTAVDVSETRFWYYALRFLNLHEWRAGSGQPLLTQSVLQSIPAPTAPATDRARIASVLGAFDDLIETDWQTADDLAQLAALAFQQAANDQPEAALGDLLSLAYGKALPAPRRNPGPIPVVSSAGITGYHDEALVSGPGVVVGRKGTVGSVTWVPTDFYPIDTAFYAKSDLPPEIVYHLLAAAGLSDLNSDSAVPGLNRDRALSQPSPDIRGEIAESIQGWLKPLMSGVDELRSEADDLARQRDELLPLLMSGRVRVSEMEGVA